MLLTDCFLTSLTICGFIFGSSQELCAWFTFWYVLLCFVIGFSRILPGYFVGILASVWIWTNKPHKQQNDAQQNYVHIVCDISTQLWEPRLRWLQGYMVRIMVSSQQNEAQQNCVHIIWDISTQLWEPHLRWLQGYMVRILVSPQQNYSIIIAKRSATKPCAYCLGYIYTAVRASSSLASMIHGKNYSIITTKRSATKPCAYCVGYIHTFVGASSSLSLSLSSSRWFQWYI